MHIYGSSRKRQPSPAHAAQYRYSITTAITLAARENGTSWLGPTAVVGFGVMEPNPNRIVLPTF